MQRNDRLTVSKLHACGNDFLIALMSPAAARSLDRDLQDHGLSVSSLARQICERRFGIGADGLILAIVASSAELAEAELPAELPADWNLRPVDGGDARGSDIWALMLLHNSDGSRAAISGNGLACLGHALVSESGDGDRGQSPGDHLSQRVRGRPIRLQIGTDAGWQAVCVGDLDATADEPDARLVEVAMPPVEPGPSVPASLADQIGRDFGADAMFETASIGNEHLVVLAGRPLSRDETARHGAAYESCFQAGSDRDGINIEFVWPLPHRDGEGGSRTDVGMTVWERGVGITDACGSGAVVAAVRARDWFVPRDQEAVTVQMPGAQASIGRFDQDADADPPTSLRLCVATHHVADITYRIARIGRVARVADCRHDSPQPPLPPIPAQPQPAEHQIDAPAASPADKASPHD